jgi:hypothetical protein
LILPPPTATFGAPVRRITSIVLASAAALVPAACGAEQQAQTVTLAPETVTVAAPEAEGATTMATSDAETVEASPPPPAADANARVSWNCDYLPPEASQSQGYRFVADAAVRNTGNIGIIVRVRATWAQIGGPPVARTKAVRVPVQKGRTVRFDLPATQLQIDRHQSAGSRCRVRGTMVNTFGVPRS